MRLLLNLFIIMFVVLESLIWIFEAPEPTADKMLIIACAIAGTWVLRILYHHNPHWPQDGGDG